MTVTADGRQEIIPRNDCQKQFISIKTSSMLKQIGTSIWKRRGNLIKKFRNSKTQNLRIF